MVDSPAFNLSSIEQAIPRALLDAGDEEWPALVDAAQRLIGEMATGAVLEVRSLAPSTRRDIPAWCRSAGHEVLWRPEDNILTRFWIRKGTR